MAAAMANSRGRRCIPLFLHLLVSWWSIAADALLSVDSAAFLIASAPTSGQIYYVRIRRGRSLSTMGGAPQNSMQVLVNGLQRPHGVVVDQMRQKLIVADSQARKIFSYPLSSYEDTLSVGSPTVLVSDVEAQWVAVDGMGTVYFSDESRNQIVQLSSDKALRGEWFPDELFGDNNTDQVSTPGGIAADAFYVYWVNTQTSEEVGSVVRGLARETTSADLDDVMVLSRAGNEAIGMCTALDNVYFTHRNKTISVVKKVGGDVVIVSDQMNRPRGCISDSVDTVYIADQGAGAVYSFAGGMQELGGAQLSKVVDLEDVFDVAIYSTTLRCVSMAGANVVLLWMGIQVACILSRFA